MHTTALSYGTYLPVRCVLSANASRSHGFATPHNTKLNSKILGARYIHSISSLSSLRKIRHVLISASSKDLPDTDNNDNDDDNEDFLPEDFALDEEFDEETKALLSGRSTMSIDDSFLAVSSVGEEDPAFVSPNMDSDADPTTDGRDTTSQQRAFSFENNEDIDNSPLDRSMDDLDSLIAEFRQQQPDDDNDDDDALFAENGEDSLNNPGEEEQDDDDDEEDDSSHSSQYPESPPRSRMLHELLESAGYGHVAATAPNMEINHIVTCNSETPVENSLYVCVPSEDGQFDGHDWADEAAELGAVAVLAERPLPGSLLPVAVVDSTLGALGKLAAEFYDHPSERLRTVSFIGSYGKTMSAWLARGIFEESGELVAMINNSEYAIHQDRLTPEGDIWAPDEDDPSQSRECSVPFHMVPYQGRYELPLSTPDALHMQKVLASAADKGAKSAVIEICPSLAGDGRVDALHSDIIVFTNVDMDKARLDPEGSDAYVERIAGVFENLDENQTAIINLDDPCGPMFARLVEDSDAQLLTYALSNKDADIYIEKSKASIWETEMFVLTPVGRLEIISALIGSFNISNVLAAVSVGLARGIKLVNIVAGIESVDVIPGRCELISEGPFPVLVDAARTPQQLSRLLDEVKEAGSRRTILVMGCPGSSTKEHRAAMGSVAHYKSDVVFFTNDSPGEYLPNRIISDVVAGMPEEILGRHAGSHFPWLQDPKRTPPWFEPWILRYQSEVNRYIIEDRFTAIRVAIGLAKQRDVVVVAGRGDLDYVDHWDGASPPKLDRNVANHTLVDAAMSIGNEEVDDELKALLGIDGTSDDQATIRLRKNDPTGNEFDDANAEWEEVPLSEVMSLPTGTLRGWFDDRVECRNAVSKLGYLNSLKDLDRSTIPWTRYPEEREQSALSSTVGGEASGTNLDMYLKSVVDELKGAREAEDSEEEEEEDEEEEEEEDLEEDLNALQ